MLPYLTAGNHQNDEHEEKKPKQVVKLVFVDGGKYEEQLNEACSER